MEGLLWAIAEAEGSELGCAASAPIILFRLVRGLWACCNPDCSEIADEYRSGARQVGRLYATPRVQCACGSRVLELLYCYECGEPFLGGFAEEVEEEDAAWYLTAGAGHHARWEQETSCSAVHTAGTCGYWPGPCPPRRAMDPQHAGGRTPRVHGVRAG